ncbi:hypothetical protein [Sphaerimonospora thailandensis]|uniref:Uncharacterized protein n=1 Tax=Sphaerimonospora thailandensis TaxID=795644 RepID=A0A8J3RC08_9ACTN|nr:hypothetical protein [Sphaerimonospora thailandensis]GIH71835.1 hypothetical protein Mth01_40880 [Sphaerimonospora thailandensis]
MADQFPEDPLETGQLEQTGPLVRPYIQADPRYGTGAGRFWSDRPDEMPPHPGPAAAGVTSDGDLLSADWTREHGRDRAPAEHDEYGEADGAAGHEDHDERDDPKGFLGAGWRGQGDPEEFGERRRGGVLLRVAGVGVAVVAAIWALSAWAGGPSESCTGDCTAKAPVMSSPAVSAEPIDESVADPVPTETTTPAQTPSPIVRLGTAPTSGPAVTPTAKATPARRPPVSPTASHPAVIEPQSSEKTTEPTAPPVSSVPSDPPPATGEATSAPEPPPTQEPEDRRRGGLLGWLF